MKIAIAGCLGRMGLTLVRAVSAAEGVTLVGGSERHGFDSGHAQTQLAADGCGNMFLTSDPDELVAKADAIIDFTTPESTLSMAESVAAKGGIHIIGTTGFTPAQMEKLKAFSKKSRIVQAGNFSLGVSLMEKLVEQAAKILDESYDIEISEFHHKHKKDAPSGTALMLGRAAAQGRKVDFDKKKQTSRNGERKSGDIGFAVMRGGDVVGEHSVYFSGPGEVLEFRHQGFSRDIYANGAIKAALWARKQKPGLYSMKDVLDF